MFRIIVDGELLEVCVYTDYSEAKKYAYEKYHEYTNDIKVEKAK